MPDRAWWATDEMRERSETIRGAFANAPPGSTVAEVRDLLEDWLIRDEHAREQRDDLHRRNRELLIRSRAAEGQPEAIAELAKEGA